MPAPFEQVLLVGDTDRSVENAVGQAISNATVTVVPTYFDAIAELTANRYTAVIASAEPIERRPEAAVQTLRQLTGEGRLILFGQPSLVLSPLQLTELLGLLADFLGLLKQVNEHRHL